MLPRVLEPEVMDSPAEARDYDAMDHGEVNEAFVRDLIAAGFQRGDVLDVGTGTARIPIELCRQVPNCRVMAVDMAVNMLELARYNVEAAGLRERIQLVHADAKRLAMPDQSFHAVVSNSIVHHIPQPVDVLRQMVRMARRGGLLLVRDLMRPADDASVRQLVQVYAGHENQHQQQMFEASLRAALTLDEIRQLVTQLGFEPQGVSATSDRHWTWSAIKPDP